MTLRRRSEELMGMVIGIEVPDDTPRAQTDSGIDAAFAFLHWVDETFSTYRPTSQVSRLGRRELSPAECHPLVVEVLARCEELRQETDGFFDIAADPACPLDPSGLVKGWAVDRVSDDLAAAGVTSHCVNAGGDVRTRGRPAPRRPWHVAVAHPLDRSAAVAVVRVEDGAVATSGTSERGLHVFDPHTGRPVADLASVTVLGPNLADADAFATAALAMGMARAPDWLEGLDGHEAIVIDGGGFEWSSRGFAAHRLALVEHVTGR